MNLVIYALLFLPLWVGRAGAKKTGNEKKVNVAAIMVPPFVMENKQGELEGFFVDFLSSLANIVGLDYTIRETSGNTPGSRGIDGRWNGIVGDLTQSKADMGGLLIITSAAERVVDFSKPVLSTGVVIAYRNNATTTDTDNHFCLAHKPFTLAAWILVGVSFIVVIILIATYQTCLGGCGNNNQSASSKLRGSFSRQGSRSLTWASKVLIVASVVCGVITAAMYTAALNKLLSVGLKQTGGPPFESVDDLLKQSQVPVACVWGGTEQMFLRTSKITAYERLYRRIVNGPEKTRPKSYEAALELTKQGYAVVMDKIILEYARQNDCKLMQVGGALSAVSYSIATPLGSEFRDTFNLAVLEMRESGTIHKLYTKWLRAEDRCAAQAFRSSGRKENAQNDDVVPFTPLSIKELSGPYVLLVLGALISILAAIIEKTCVTCRRRKDDELDEKMSI